jgi:hypothetical protein
MIASITRGKTREEGTLVPSLGTLHLSTTHLT